MHDIDFMFNRVYVCVFKVNKEVAEKYVILL